MPGVTSKLDKARTEQRVDNAKDKAGNSFGPVAAVIWTVFIYLLPQLFCGLLVSFYPAFRHWDSARAGAWFSNAVSAQFVYSALAESSTIVMVWLLLKNYKLHWRSIGLAWPKKNDVVYALGGFGVYIVVYLALAVVAMLAVPALNLDRQQDVGFTHASGTLELLMAFISLVVLPPLAEEIVFRGFLFKGLRNRWSFKTTAIVTSVLFAAPHLIEGVGGLLWLGGLDVFVMSVVLCYLREKTGRITAGIAVHAMKNGLAFAMLFIFHVR